MSLQLPVSVCAPVASSPTAARTNSAAEKLTPGLFLAAATGAQPSLKGQAQAIITWLERHGTKRTRDGMARYAIPSDKAFGVPVGTFQKYAKRLGRNHDLAAALWDTGWYESRMLAAYVDELERVTPAQMDRSSWVRMAAESLDLERQLIGVEPRNCLSATHDFYRRYNSTIGTAGLKRCRPARSVQIHRRGLGRGRDV